MNDKFDELAKGLAQSVTRRGALKQFGVGLVGIALAWVGIVNQAYADRVGGGPGCGKVKKMCNGCVTPYGCSDPICENKYSTLCGHCFPGCC
jgi:hypothetical protein